MTDVMRQDAVVGSPSPRSRLPAPQWVAVGLLALAAAVRLDVLMSTWFALDDLVWFSRDSSRPFSWGRLFSPYISHLMPAGLALVEAHVRLTPWSYGTAVAFTVTLRVITWLVTWALFKRLFSAGWLAVALLALTVWLPLTLAGDAWWAASLNGSPFQLASACAVLFLVRFHQTRRTRYAVLCSVAMIGGLAFFEKAVMIFPLVVIVLVTMLLDGSTRERWRAALRGYRAVWVPTGLIAAAYPTAYFAWVPIRQGPRPALAAVPATAVNLDAHSYATMVLGGPWGWVTNGVGVAYSAPPAPLVWLAWAVVAGVVGLTVWFRREAWWPWSGLAAYLILNTAMVASGRLTFAGPLLGYVTHYLGDTALPTVLALGVALTDSRRDPGHPVPDPLRTPGEALATPWVVRAGVAMLAVVMAGSVLSTARFAQAVSRPASQGYVSNLRADAAAHPGIVIGDLTVPTAVMWPLFFPDNLPSHLFARLPGAPRYATVLRDGWMADDAGHIVRATVSGIPAVPTSQVTCQYPVGDAGVSIPLSRSVPAWAWWVHVGYLADRSTPLDIAMGGTTYHVTLDRGLNNVFVQVVAGGASVRVSGVSGGAHVCVGDLEVGNLVPAPPSAPRP